MSEYIEAFFSIVGTIGLIITGVVVVLIINPVFWLAIIALVLIFK